MKLSEILPHLKQVKKSGNGYVCQCPHHNDNSPSLSITEKDAQLLFHCHAGCKSEDVFEMMKKLVPPKPKKRITNTYDYVDLDGVLRCQTVRYEPKDFRQRQPGPGGDWIWNLRGVELIPYNLPAVAACKKGVVIVEGEKDADNLIRLGICATTSPAGAKKWRSGYSQYFKDKPVIIIADNDDAGREHADIVCSSLQGVAKSIKQVTLPGPDKSDVSDWLASGGTKEKLADIIVNTKEWQPKKKPENIEQNSTITTSAQQPETIREAPAYIDWPHQTDKGQAFGTIENLRYLLNQFKISVKYNAISKQEEIHIPGTSYSLDNSQSCALNHIISLAAQYRLPTGNIPDYMINLAEENKRNPVADWISSKPWDKQDRFNPLVKTLSAKNEKLAKLFLRRWLISAVAAVFLPEGVSAQGVLVLQGDQNIGKTSWFWSLLGKHRHWGKEGACLNPNDRDSVKQVLSYWLVELGEMEATFRKSDIAALRGFITKDFDEVRLPYARRASVYPRRTVFMASVNEREYLRDETGNRRYWTIQCAGKLNARHDIDMQQLWAQALTWFHAGEPWNLQDDEINQLNDYNIKFESIDPIEEKIKTNYDLDAPAKRTATATEILEEIGYEKPNKKQQRDASAILRKLLKQEPRRLAKGRVFDIPEINNRAGF